MDHEHSWDGICDQLGDMPVSKSLFCYIVKTLQKVPDDVRDFVYENCEFVSVEAPAGQTIHTQCVKLKRRPWLIILTENDLTDDYMSIIAHEVAHAYSGHENYGIGTYDEAKRTENEACSLAKQWGFAGTGTELYKCLDEE